MGVWLIPNCTVVSTQTKCFPRPIFRASPISRLRRMPLAAICREMLVVEPEADVDVGVLAQALQQMGHAALALISTIRRLLSFESLSAAGVSKWPIGSVPLPNQTVPAYRAHGTAADTQDKRCRGCGDGVAGCPEPDLVVPSTAPGGTCPEDSSRCRHAVGWRITGSSMGHGATDLRAPLDRRILLVNTCLGQRRHTECHFLGLYLTV